jgi:hypothetical protein
MATPARINFVESVNWSGVTGTTYASPAQSVTAGNTLVVCIGGNAQSAQTVTGVTDTAGHTYIKIAHVFHASDKYRQEIWVAANITTHATNVVTTAWSAAIDYRGIVVIQYSNLDTTTPLDDTEQFTTGLPLTTPTLTGTTTESVHILMVRWGFGGSGFPAGFTQFASGGAGTAEVADKIVTSGAFSGTYTVSPGNYFVIAVILKNAATVVSTGTTQFMIVMP